MSQIVLKRLSSVGKSGMLLTQTLSTSKAGAMQRLVTRHEGRSALSTEHDSVQSYTPLLTKT